MDDDGDDKDDTKRRTRNMSEKKRRDQFNMLVNELSSMLSTNNRKMDKSTVLKSTISFLRNHNEIVVRSRAHDVQADWKPPFLSNEEFTYLVLDALEGFMMVFSVTGKIYYVSEGIASLLGHNPVDVVNKNIFDLTHENDRPQLYNILQMSSSTTVHIQEKEMVRFNIHVRRAGLDKRDAVTYDLVTFNGHFKTNMDQLDKDLGCEQDTDSRVLFLCTGTLHTHQLIRDVSLVDPTRSEFTSRHSLEWKFLFLDHRAPPIIGYLPFEVLGTSGYDYYHFDDLEKVVECHEALMQKGEVTSCYYRFLTKGQQWLWLQTRFYITYHQWNSKPEFVVCTHRVVSYAEVTKSTKEEDGEQDAVNEVEVNSVAKEPPEDTTVANVSPSYMSEPNDAIVGSYQTHTQDESDRQAMADALSDDVPMAPVSPSYLSEASDNYAASYRSISQPATIKTTSAGSTVGTVAAASGNWSRASQHRYNGGSDVGSISGESRSSRNSTRTPGHGLRHGRGHGSGHGIRHEHELNIPVQDTLTPLHGIGAQYLDPAPYVGAVGVPGVLPLPIPSLPVIVTQDQAQIQEQLQRKHEELQQMIVRQQEELRQVKEQLLLARLGILQPIINVPYANPEELQQQALSGRHSYEVGSRALTYPTPLPSLPPHGPQPPHPPGPNNHMPQ